MRQQNLVIGALMVAALAHGADPPKTAIAPTKYPSLHLMGFGDVNYYNTEDETGETKSGFRNGQFVLHFVSQLSTRFSMFAEISLTARSNEYNIEVERLIVKYDYNDNFKLGFGRFHTAISWWNTAYHHGAWLQTTIDRPLAVRFGSQLVPIHFVGVVAEGAIPSGSVGLNYIVGIGNGRGEIIARGGDAGDINSDRALNARVFARPDVLYGLEVGISYYSDTITQETALQEYDEWIGSAYIVYDRDAPQVIAEYFHVEHEGVSTGEVSKSDAFYVQVAYRLPWWKALLMPYARYESTDIAENEQVFSKEFDLERYLLGVRIDVSSYVAVKAEYRHESIDSGPFLDGIFAQIAFTF
jgi:hypothetical protein